MLILLIYNKLMHTFNVIYLCTRVRVEYPTIYINIEAIQHILIVIHIYAFEKNIHSHAQDIASKLTLNYILNICYYKLTTHIWNIYHTNFIVSAYWKANYILHTFAFKREFHAIIHPFRKIIIHTWQGIPLDRKSTRLNSSHCVTSRMPSSA